MAAWNVSQHKSLNLVVIGRKGDGKSSTANTILGRLVFSTSGPVTKCQSESCKSLHGFANVTIIDTPGIFHTHIENLLGMFDLAPDGIDAFILVIRIGTFTDVIQHTLKYYREIFGAEVARNTIAVFVGLDELGDTFENYCKHMPQDIDELLPKARIGINNRSDEKSTQAISILQQVEQMTYKERYTSKDVPKRSPLYKGLKQKRIMRGPERKKDTTMVQFMTQNVIN
ncbi:GTPase IMAP family member 6-like [Amphiura filiformis]|uniref:GTPase IMAP family member 6-like n=1 Tax=Amphiura filiformis TaxID=82378 RepID=UPI003B215B71